MEASEGEGRVKPLCGDETCESPGCTQEALDVWVERQWEDAGRIVYSLLGLPYVKPAVR